MPTLLIENSFRRYFFANETDEPVHVYVQYQKAIAKFWLSPVALAKNKDTKSHEKKQEKSFGGMKNYFRKNGMNSSAKNLDHEFIAIKVWFHDDSIIVSLDDGREIKVPLEFYLLICRKFAGKTSSSQTVRHPFEDCFRS